MNILTLLLIFVNVLIRGKHCFNFDINFPVIYKHPALKNDNIDHSYFGYSVILYVDEMNNPWIQIGAPKGGTPQLHAGEVFRCPVGRKCNRVIFGTSRDIPQRNGSWIGGGMDVDFRNKRVVVCGHRWFQIYTAALIEDQRMQGICYWQYIDGDHWNLLRPLENSYLQVYGSQAYYYGQGQAGFSAQFSNSRKNPELLLGAPGFFNWGGMPLLYKFFNSEAIAYIPDNEKLKVFRSFGFGGYQVSSGYFFQREKLLYVAGSPRFASHKECKGKVTIGNFVKFTTGAVEFYEEQSLKGSQMGGYFGAALAVGDINGDGFDDLIVGAPYYSNDLYNEGRVYIFFGNGKAMQMQIPNNNPTVTGKAVNGLFGLSIAILGDIDSDGYKDIAIAAPYEDALSGAIYIFRGNKDGINDIACQKIDGRSVDVNLKGFGISMAKPVDVDGNHFNDLAVGSYLSGHAVLLRSKPIIYLELNVTAHEKILQRTAENFTVTICYWFKGNFLPKKVDIRRSISADLNLQRVIINSGRDKTITVSEKIAFCEEVVMSIYKDQTHYFHPINVAVEQVLVESVAEKSPMYFDNGGASGSQLSDFCKTCPVLDGHKSKLQESIIIPFTLECGDDNVCTSDLDVSANFPGLKDNTFIVGSTGLQRLVITVNNFNESAYSAQLQIEFPKVVSLGKLPSKCSCETCSYSTEDVTKLNCDLGNPLVEQKTITLGLNVKNVGLDFNKVQNNVIAFKMSVSTSSQEINEKNNENSIALHLTSEADVAITGNTEQGTTSFVNVDSTMINFTQQYEVNKYGQSPIEDVWFTIQIPTEIKENGDRYIKFLDMYNPEGAYASQPIRCTSNITYVEENEKDKLESTLGNAEVGGIAFENEEGKFAKGDNNDQLSNVRSKRDTALEEIDSNATNSLPPTNRTLFINCSMDDVICSKIDCNIGPMKNSRLSASLKLKMIINIPKLKPIMGKKNIVYLSTDGLVSIKLPDKFIQSGHRSDTTSVSNIFLGEVPAEKVQLSTIISAVGIGFLILLFIFIGLVKAGFFKRTQRMEMQRLKEDAQKEQDNQAEAGTSADTEELIEEDDQILVKVANEQ